MSPNEERRMESLSSTLALHLQRVTSKNESEVNEVDAATVLHKINNTNLSKRSNSRSKKVKKKDECHNFINGIPPPSDEIDSLSMNGKYHSTFKSLKSSSQIPSYWRPKSSYFSLPMTIQHHRYSSTKSQLPQQQHRRNSNIINNIKNNSSNSSSTSQKYMGRRQIFLSLLALIVLSCSTFVYFTMNLLEQAKNNINNNIDVDNAPLYSSLLRPQLYRRLPSLIDRPRIITFTLPRRDDESMIRSENGRSNNTNHRQIPFPVDNDEIRQDLRNYTTQIFELPLVNRSIIYLTDNYDQTIKSSSSSFFSFFFNNKNSLSTKKLPIKEEDEETKQKNCMPMAKWMTSSYPNCNSVHELDMSSSIFHTEKEENLSFLGQGWFRSVWKYKSESSFSLSFSTPAVVLKTLRIEREFLDEYFDLHRRDAVAMERLTFSPFVVNVHGYCGQSAINELAEGIVGGAITSLEQLNRRLRGKEEDPQALFLKLQLATGVALGLAHIHNVHVSDESGGRSKSVKSLLYEHTDPNSIHSTTGFGRSVATMAHYDINPRNIAIMRDGSPKLNDFNTAEFLTYDPKTNATCGFRSRLHEPWWRAPEEMDMTHTTMVTEKVDVYALGEVLFHILTTHSPRGKMKKHLMEDARSLVREGVRPVMREPFLSGGANGHLKHNRIVKAFVKAMDLCYEKNPRKRGTAIQIARVLHKALTKEELDRQKK